MGMLLHLSVLFITKRHSVMSWLNCSSLSLGCINLNKMGSYFIIYCDGPACWYFFLYLSHLDPAYPNWPLWYTYGGLSRYNFTFTSSHVSSINYSPLWWHPQNVPGTISALLSTQTQACFLSGARNFKYKQAKEPVPARVALQWEQHINYRLCVQPKNVRSLGPGGLKSSASRRIVYTHWYNIHNP